MAWACPLRALLYAACAVFAALLVAATANSFLASPAFTWLAARSVIPFYNDSHTRGGEKEGGITVDKHLSWSFQVGAQSGQGERQPCTSYGSGMLHLPTETCSARSESAPGVAGHDLLT